MVECNLAKVDVASSNLVSRSKLTAGPETGRFRFYATLVRWSFVSVVVGGIALDLTRWTRA